MEVDWTEKIYLFITNISPYYAFSVTISVIAVIFSFWYTRRCEKEAAEIKSSDAEVDDQQMNIDESCDNDSCSENEDRSKEDEDNTDLYDDEEGLDVINLTGGLEDLQARYKTARHQAIVEHLSSKMTPEQIVEERQTEKAQLEAILNLLKEQQEKFQVSDMTDLEEQLSLYRL